MKRSSTGLRARLLLLVFFAVVPAFGLIGYTTIKQRDAAAVSARENAGTVVRLAAQQYEQLIAATRQLLIGMSQLTAIRQFRNAPACSQTLAQLLQAYPYYTNFGLAAPDGRVVCSALPLKGPASAADRSYFIRALRSRDFSVGDYQIGRISGIEAINFGYPILDADKNVQAVVYAALDLRWIEQLMTTAHLPEGSTLTVVDSRGTILARYPDIRQWVGKPLPDAPLVQTLLAHRGAGTAQLEGLDGVRRLYAFAPLQSSASGDVYVSVGIPTAVAFASANQDLKLNLLILAIVAALALVATWAGSEVFVLRRVNALTAAARRLTKGDLNARTGLPHGGEELGELAGSFDEMATALQRVHRALKTLSAGNRVMMRATDEQMLLAEMCRSIVEVGGYRAAWIAFTQGERQSFHPVAQHGFEGGLKALFEVLNDITSSETQNGQGAFGVSFRTGKPFVSQNILTDPALVTLREEAIRRGYASGAIFPVMVHGKAVGAVGICAQEADAFQPEELELLNEAVEDLGFGIGIWRARTEHDHANAIIEHLARYDRLTGLPNYAHFQERLRQVLSAASAHDQSVALLTVDLRRLSEINNALGYPQGDLLLKEVARRLGGAFGDSALVARPRGDEFAVLSMVRDADDAASVANRILAALKEPFTAGDLNLDITATIGIALFPQHSAEPARLVRHADVARDQAKRLGWTYAFYDATQDQDGTRRLALAAELRRAIEGDELVLHYQPKIDMRSGAVCGVEALVRWMHPQRGLIPPDNFIPLAEQTGLIKALTDRIISIALRQSSVWRQHGLVMSIAVNLSARNLHDAGLLGHIDKLFGEWGAQPDWLEFEITEGAVMQDAEGALQVLQRLSELGLPLFIDDFGTGYSSLSYLKRLPVDAVKIDKSFVADMLSNADSAAIVRSTIVMAHELDMKVVAEGVEGAAVWNRLRELGCDTAQGYAISKPLPADQFKDWYVARGRKIA